MLNCCIKHKQTASSGPPPEVVEEDEFFDAEESLDSMDETPQKQRHSAWNQPQGRSERTKMKLLGSGETLYEPVTQESLPMTEDMVEEQAEMMEQLGDSAQGSELRAKILSASLLSDMEAFKVAHFSAVYKIIVLLLFCLYSFSSVICSCTDVIFGRTNMTRYSRIKEFILN